MILMVVGPISIKMDDHPERIDNTFLSKLKNALTFQENRRVEPDITLNPVNNYYQLVERKLNHSERRKEMKYAGWISYSFGGVCGIFINSRIRIGVRLYEGAAYGTVLICFIAVGGNKFVRERLINYYQKQDSLSCKSCAVIRSTVGQTITSIIIPSVLATGMTGVLSERYGTGKLVDATMFDIEKRKQFIKFWRSQLSKVFLQLSPLFAVTLAVNALCASKIYDIIEEAKNEITAEEHMQMKNRILSQIHNQSWRR